MPALRRLLRRLRRPIGRRRPAYTGRSSELVEIRHILQSAKDFAILTMDMDGFVTSWSPGAQALTGFSSEEMIGRDARILFVPQDVERGQPELEMERARREGRSEDERWHVHKHGKRFWGSGLMMPLRDDNGAQIGYVKIMRDQTRKVLDDERLNTLNAALEQRVLERTNELASADRKLERFEYSLAHDLRGPLRRMDGFARILQAEYADRLDKRACHMLERIRESSQHMAKGIDSILEMSRAARRPLRHANVDLSEAARKIIDQLKSLRRDRDVAWHVQPGLCARGDAELLHLLLFHLLQNAWKYTSTIPEARIEFGAQGEGIRSVYYVCDNGAGFDMAHAGKLFIPFTRLHGGDEFWGSGTGLAVAATIVERHGGRIWASSEQGRGATFYFTLSGSCQNP